MPPTGLVRYDIFLIQLGDLQRVGIILVPTPYFAHVRLEAEYIFTKHSTTGEVTHRLVSFPALILPHEPKRSDKLPRSTWMRYDIYTIEPGQKMKLQGVIGLPQMYFAHVRFETIAIAVKPGSQETEQLVLSVPTILLPRKDNAD